MTSLISACFAIGKTEIECATEQRMLSHPDGEHETDTDLRATLVKMVTDSAFVEKVRKALVADTQEQLEHDSIQPNEEGLE